MLGAIICSKYFVETMLFFAYTTMENEIITVHVSISDLIS